MTVSGGYTASGGFAAHLTHSGDLVAPAASILASEHAMFKSRGITLDSTLFTADANGNKIAKAGLVVGKVTATGKYGPYDNAAADGREVAAGVLIQGFDVTGGDVIANLLIHGSVYAARCTGLDTNARTDLAQIIFQ